MREAPPEVELLRGALASVGRAKLRTSGESMLPTIRPGTVITLVDRPFGEVVPGDVTVAVIGRKLITHRVVDRAAGGLLTLGDNLPLIDPVMRPDDYLAVVPEYHRVVLPRAPDLTALAALPDTGSSRTRIWIPGPPPTYHPCDLAARPDDPLDGPFDGPFDDIGPGRRDARPVIGVSPYGALPESALDEILAAAGRRDIDVLLGYTFGDPTAGPVGPPPLRPGTADFHVRFGTTSPAETAEFVRARIRAIRGIRPTAVSAGRSGRTAVGRCP
ncbi:S24/S26 family peptidase [Embleya sp. AB8]|uniref:S24/S26 family peptidase n=1 Tax=Embleya sp. AB8 TaxID=3156304 RepID=UPI003C72BA70